MELRKLVGKRPIVLCGAGALIMDGQDRVLLQHRRDNDHWGIPGGSVEPGETVEETARREVLEETGLTLGEVALFGVYSGQELHYTYPHGDEVYIISNVFITHDYQGEIAVDEAESKEIRFFHLDELPPINPPDRPVLRDCIEVHTDKKAMPTYRHPWISAFDMLWEVSEGLTRRFPEGNDPFRIMTRLLEECGELAEQVHHFENLGVKRQKLGEPDRGKLAKEAQDVVRCVLQLAQYYGIQEELQASVYLSYRSLQNRRAKHR